ncbi:hypothetical protein [Leptospira noguchii]|uniref:hypothetical protein n=1 Tax=Leptospira noguchii TaxID=28182 RepID=UPI001FB57503|nr:hypothetical protein [Leptospira noguchii]UOG32797.1 hypothetical protein MAL06_21110 [Leptospira noguchii]
MINESYYWKKELYKIYRRIAILIASKEKKEESYYIIEKGIFLASYIIRKLREGRKFPKEIFERRIPLTRFNRKEDSNIELFNNHRFDELYNLENSYKHEVNYEYLVNQIIHSFSFSILVDEFGSLNGFLINSDRSKNSTLYLVLIEQFLFLILLISEGDLTSALYERQKIVDSQLNLIGKREIELISGNYEYPAEVNLDFIVQDTMRGQIYKRKRA